MFKQNFWHNRLFLFPIMVAIIIFLQGSLWAADDFTLEQLVTGVNLLRAEIQSGELLLSITGYESPIMTAAEAQQWLSDRRAQVRQEAAQRVKADPEYDGERHYTYHMQQYSEMFQRLVDKIDFHRDKSVSFEVYGAPPPFGHRGANFRYRSVTNNRLIDYSKPYSFPDYFISIFDGETQKVAYEYRRAGVDSEDRYAGYQESDFDVYDQFGRGLATIPLDAARFVRQETIDGISSYLVEFQIEDISMLVRYWVAPEKGYCILKAEYIQNRSGVPPVIHQVVYNSDFRQFSGGIWYPTHRTVTSYFLDGSRQGEIRSEERVETRGALFNVNFPADYFRIDTESAARLGMDSDGDRSAGSSPVLLECGPRSLLMVCNLLGVETSFAELAELSAFSPQTGTTMAGLYTAAQSKKLNPVGVKTSITDLQRLEMPVIAHVNQDHFLVVTRIADNNVYCLDPVELYGMLSLAEFEKIWGGHLLLFTVDKQAAGMVAAAEPPQENQPQESQQPVPREVEAPAQKSVKEDLLIEIESPIYDFGEVFGGTEVEHIFTFTNRGDEVLEITDVESSCYCTTGFLSDTRIPPGGTGKLKVAFKAPPRSEVVHEVVKLTTNQPQIPHFELAVKASVITPFEAIPARLLLGKISPHSFSGRHLLLRQTLAQKAKVVGIQSSSDYMTAELDPPSRNGNVRVQITVEAGMPVGTFTESLGLDFAYEGRRYSWSVPISGEILGDVSVSPKQLFLGIVKPSEVPGKRVQLSRLRGDHLEISAVQTGSQYVDAKVETLELGNQYEVQLSIGSDAPDGDLTDTLIVRTNSKNQPEIKIPIYGVVKR